MKPFKMRVLLLLFVVGLAYGQSIDESKLTQTLKAKCSYNALDEDAFEEAKQAFVIFGECARSTFSEEPPNPVEYHEAFCNYLRNSEFYSCVKNLTSAVAPCLDDTETYLPDLIHQAVNSTYDELCGPQGVANSNLIFDKMTANRGCSGYGGIALSEWECLSELDIMKDIENGRISFNQHNVCSNLDKLQSCMKSVLERTCPNDQSVQVIDLIFTPFTEECNV